LDLDSLGLGGSQPSDLDLEELTNEVDGLETLAKEMQTLVRLNNADNNKREKLTKTRDQRPDRPKGGKRKKKQAKRPKAQRKSGKVSSSKSGGGSSVTLCQLMNICDTIPMGSRTVEGKVGPPYGDIPFASSKRSELVVEAPTSHTSNSTLEKKPRMEESEFEDVAIKHREIEFSQGLPVRGSERLRGVIEPRNTKVEYLKRPGQKSDASLPISFINFDSKPSAPSRTRTAKDDTGNLYENMARQLEAFLERRESRHPKMVGGKTTNQTNDLVGGKQDNTLDQHGENLVTNEETMEEGGSKQTAVKDFQVSVGAPLKSDNNQIEQETNTNGDEKVIKVDKNGLPTMEIETHSVNGERHSQRVYANGWTPLVIGSVPGMAEREQTTFMARMLDFSTSTSLALTSAPTSASVPASSWQPSSQRQPRDE